MISAMKAELTDLAAQAKTLSDAYLEEKRNGYLYIAVSQSGLKSQLALKKSLIYSIGFVGMLELSLVLHGVYEKEKREGEE